MNELLGDQADELRMEMELVQGASHPLDLDDYLAGRQTPVFFGSAINNFGVQELLDAFVQYAPPPRTRQTTQRPVSPDEAPFSGFVFKIQANMDPAHRDRIAFLRVCSGSYKKGMKMRHVRLGETRCRSPMRLPSRPPSASTWRRPGPVTSSGSTTTAPSRSATPSPRVKT